jgi:phosphate-selective porin OprO and OprP
MKRSVRLIFLLLMLWSVSVSASPRFGGRVEWDTSGFLTDGHGDGEFFFRRMKMGLRDAGPVYAWRLDLDFSDQDPEFKDVWLSADHGRLQLRTGQFKMAQGLTSLTAAPHNPFPEKSMLNELTPGRRLGLGAVWLADVWLAQATIFSGEIEDYDWPAPALDPDGAAGRLVWTPRRAVGRVMHFGASLSVRDPGTSLSIAADPEVGADLPSLLDTGDLSQVRRLETAGVEFLQIIDTVMLQGEYLVSRVNRPGFDDLHFSGGYLQATWAPQGRPRDYRFNGSGPGVAGGLPHDGLRWELALRAGRLDLDGAEGTQFDIGVNLFPRDEQRLMLHYLRAYRQDQDQGYLDLWTGRMEFSF